jgi:aerobic carbon-monoxide dehydrogenase large subunit
MTLTPDPQTQRKGRYFGTGVRRREDKQYTTGNATFVDDIKLEGMLYCAFTRSPYGHARIIGIETKKAAEHEGVVKVITADELDRETYRYKIEISAPVTKPLSYVYLAKEKVRYVGEPVAAVIATDRGIAEDAAELVEVEYEELPVIVDAETALKRDAPLLYPEWKENLFVKWELRAGDVDVAFKRAAHVFKQKYRSQRYAGTPIETRGVVCDYNKGTDMLTMWTSKQDPYVEKLLFSEVLRQPENRLRVISPSVGGGFGIKLNIFAEDVVVAYAAKLLGKPVKWIEDRKEHLMVCTHAREQVHYLEAAVDNDGTLLAVRDKIIGDVGAGTTYPHTGVGSCKFSGDIITGPYKVKNVWYDIYCVVTNKFPYGAYRGFGQPEAVFAMERMMDKIARELHMDRMELRSKNVIRKEDMPYRSPSGQIYDSGDYVGELNELARLIDYKSFEKLREEKRKEGKLIGLGVAMNVESTACTIAFLPLGAHEASKVKVESDGKVTVTLGISNIGTGLETTIAQITADQLGVRIEDVNVIAGDTLGGIFSLGLYGSRGAVTCGGSTSIAADRVRRKVLSIASSMLEARVDDLDIAEGEIFVKGTRQKSVGFRDVAQIAYNMIYKLPSDVEPGLESTSYFNPPPIKGFPEEDGLMNVTGAMTSAAHAAIVEVDVKTGQLKILDYAISHDCGVSINPMIVEGQVHGGLAQGLGGALMEELVYDDNGQLLTSTFMDYLIPSTMDVPNVKVHSMEVASPYIPGGMKGTGEAALISPAPTMASALEDALKEFDVEVFQTPLTSDRVWALIRKGNQQT